MVHVQQASLYAHASQLETVVLLAGQTLSDINDAAMHEGHKAFDFIQCI